jgi:hypothetical protein
MDVDEGSDRGAQSVPDDEREEEEEELGCEHDSPRTQLIKSNIRLVGCQAMKRACGVQSALTNAAVGNHRPQC